MKHHWIDRYISEVARHLPKNQRGEVQRELESTLLDELEDRHGPDATEDDVLGVLKEMGSPSKVAESYRPSNQYLIGPEWYPIFRKVLLTVLSIHVGLLVLACAVSLFWPGASVEPGQAILYFLNAALESATFAFGIILLIFFLLERSGAVEEKPKEVWDPASLPESPAPGDLVGKGESILALSLVAIFLALLQIFRDSIGIPFTGAEELPFNDTYKKYLPWISFALVLDMAVYAWLFWRGRWEWFSRACHFAFDLFGLGVLFMLIQEVAIEWSSRLQIHLPDLATKFDSRQLYWIPISAAVVLAIEHGRVLWRARRKERRGISTL
ncbi:MAG: hypothetical protein K0U98_26145 [Deltaproteobacteria bacterium]|nr:hypothetical protein [Deltaproteobacteria bacterium]